MPPEYRRIGCLPAHQFVRALMEHRSTRYVIGLLSAAQYYGAAHHRPQGFQMMLRRNRPAIVCGSVRVVLVACKELATVPVKSFNNPRGPVLVSTVKATAFDLVGYMHRAGGVVRVLGVPSELGEDIRPERLVEAFGSSSIHWAQRLGYLLKHVVAGERAVPLKEHVRRSARNYRGLYTRVTAGRAGGGGQTLPAMAFRCIALSTPVAAVRLQWEAAACRNSTLRTAGAGLER